MTFWIIQWNPALNSWSISSPRSCMQEIKKSYLTTLRKLAKSRKKPNLTFFRPFRPWKMTFRPIQSNPSFASSFSALIGKRFSCINREKVIEQFLRKFPQIKKGAKFDLSDLLKWHLGWFNQIHIFTVHGYLPKEAVHQKRKKCYRGVLEKLMF